MRIGKKRVGGALILGAAAFIGQEFFSWLLGRLLDLASAGVSGMTWTAFPWQSALASVMALVGAYLAFWPSKRGKPSKPATLADKLYLLWTDADNFVDRVRYQRGLDWWQRAGGLSRRRNAAEDTRDIARDGISLLIRFEKGGLPVPKLDGRLYAEQVAIGCANYFETLSSFMRDGHVEHVVAMAPDAAKHAEEVATNFNADHWYLDAQERY
ncbi:hypothetical protein [Novosphingobium naphthalenivorans]|uniref:hypothetical protein n=1 Tax=Novosphingobium naphthalenivorans TaxID=273168 RepID=UPI0008308A06|nr:hypothetical protein [Novosphingobium naphthalenivorans]